MSLPHRKEGLLQLHYTTAVRRPARKGIDTLKYPLPFMLNKNLNLQARSDRVYYLPLCLPYRKQKAENIPAYSKLYRGQILIRRHGLASCKSKGVLEVSAKTEIKK